MTSKYLEAAAYWRDRAEKAEQRITELEEELTSEAAWAKTYSDKVAELEAEIEKLQPKKKSVWTTTPDSTTTYVGNINDIDVRIK
jgi:uncharacterized coiled-coil protein SlyX